MSELMAQGVLLAIFELLNTFHPAAAQALDIAVPVDSFTTGLQSLVVLLDHVRMSKKIV